MRNAGTSRNSADHCVRSCEEIVWIAVNFESLGRDTAHHSSVRSSERTLAAFVAASARVVFKRAGGFRSAYLHVLEGNVDARAFYEARGYRVASHVASVDLDNVASRQALARAGFVLLETRHDEGGAYAAYAWRTYDALPPWDSPFHAVAASLDRMPRQAFIAVLPGMLGALAACGDDPGAATAGAAPVVTMPSNDGRDTGSMGAADSPGTVPDAPALAGTDAGVATTTAPDAGTARAPASVDAGAQPGAPACELCDEYGAAALLANIQAPWLAEVSGIAASTRDPGVFFVHNDRARPVVFALDGDGAQQAQWTLEAADVSDVEDLEVGPCEAGSCLYLADIGGNITPRTEFAILRFAEPELAAASADNTITDFELFRFEYDDGENHNAEGVLIDPHSGTVYIVTKVPDGEPSAIYRLPNPLLEGSLNVATMLLELPVPRTDNQAISATAAHPCGSAVLLRTYDTIFELRAPAGGSFEDAFSATPVEVPAGDEPQSEGISYLADGRGYVSTGEAPAAPIYQTRCR